MQEHNDLAQTHNSETETTPIRAIPINWTKTLKLNGPGKPVA